MQTYRTPVAAAHTENAGLLHALETLAFSKQPNMLSNSIKGQKEQCTCG